jgi:enterochelin esterase-like enzyme
MARKRQHHLDGTLINLRHDSNILKSNPWGDPTERVHQVYLPAAYDQGSSRRRFAVLYDLVGYTGSGGSHTGWRSFDESVPERLDRLIADGKMPPVIVVFPDCFTALGGNQYINSKAIGRYADFLIRELIPAIDGEFRTKANRNHRGIFGKSSGGYGALIHGMQYAEHWGAIASHSGDCYFDYIYKSEWPAALSSLQTHTATQTPPRAAQTRPGFDDGRIRRFLDYMWSTERPSGADITALMMICMAASYDPDSRAPLGFRVPYDMNTGVLLESRWQRWLRHDPVVMAKSAKANLASLKGIYIDCGWRDQYHIHFGSRQLSATLSRMKIKHTYEEFDATHSGIDYRMDKSLPFLARRLS